MEFKDYYAKLGVERTASQDDIKRAYRKLARKYHPDVSKEPDAEARFKEVSEAYEAIGDAERRAAYDEVSRRYRHGQEFEPPPGWNGGYEFSGRGAGPGDGMDFSDFFESLFGRHAAGPHAHAPHSGPGADHHAKIVIDLEDSFRGARRTLSLRVPSTDGQGRVTWQERQLDVSIPKGVRDGQHLRLSGQGAPAPGGGPAGDLYLEVAFRPHPQFRVDGRDIHVDLPLAPWEAALGGAVTAPTPEGPVQLTVPAGSAAGRKLRLKGRGLPGQPPGDLYAVLGIVTPPADSDEAKAAYAAMARSFASFNPRSHSQR